MSQDYIALEWVKGEIEETLQQAQQALEAYVENPNDKSRLRFCLSYLHQIRGTLQMVEFYGAALLAEEMEAVARAMNDSDALTSASQAEGSPALEVLMQAILQLPHYLQHIKVGRRDLPVVLLPILNELRSVRGESVLPEAALFNPVIKHNSILSSKQAEVYNGNDFRLWAKKVRQMLQAAMLQLLQNKQPDVAKQYLRKTFARLHKALHTTPQGKIWLPALAFTEWLDKQEALTDDAKKVLGQLERLLRSAIEEGAVAVNRAPDEEVLRSLLMFVANSDVSGDAIRKVRAEYSLNNALVSDEDLEQQRNELAGPDKDTVDQVLHALVEEIATVKDRLDLLVRGHEDRTAALSDVAPSLKQITNTMAVLGLGMPRKVLQEQQSEVTRLLEGELTVEDHHLMDIAGALLYVEATLTGMKREGDLNVKVSESSLTDAQKAVLREARNVLEQVKDAIVEYIAKQWAADELADVPSLLHSIEGSLSMIPLPRVAGILSRAAAFVQNQLIHEELKPQWSVLDTLADVLTGVEYFIERYTEKPGNASEELLARAEESLLELPATESLSDAIDEIDLALDDSAEAEVEITSFDDALDLSSVDDSTSEQAITESIDSVENSQVDEDVDEEIELSDADIPAIESAVEVIAELMPVKSSSAEQVVDDAQQVEEVQLVEEVAAEIIVEASKNTVGADSVTAAESQEPAEDDDDLIDDEIIEIFLEEAEEVTETLDEFWPQFKTDHNDQEALTTVRRAFHTLKGSGRMVQAGVIGELAWSIENMFNRVLDETISISDNLIAIVDHVISCLPDLIEDFRSRRAPSHDTQPLMDYAFALAGNEVVEPFAAEATTSGNAAVPDENSEDDEDVALLEVFVAEANSHLVTVEQFIQQSRNEEFSNSLSDQLQRALHTLKGSAHMAGISAIADVAAPLEKMIKELRAYQIKNAPGIVNLVEEGDRLIREGLANDSLISLEHISGTTDFVERLNALEGLLLEPLLQAQESGNVGPSPQTIATFLAQGMDSLLDADGLLQQWQQQGDASILQQLCRDLEQVARGAAKAELPNIEVLANALNVFYGDMLAQQRLAAESPLQLLADAQEALLGMMDCLAAGQETSPATELINQLDAWEFIATEPSVVEVDEATETLVDTEEQDDNSELILADTELSVDELSATDVSDALVADDLPPVADVDLVEEDDEILEIFLEEAEEVSESIESAMERWQQQPDNLLDVAQLQRELHTLKGGARMAELQEIAELCHELETLYEKVNDGRVAVSQDLFTLLQRGHDALASQLDAVKQGQPAKSEQELIHEVLAFAGAGGHLAESTADVTPVDSAADILTETVAEAPEVLEVDLIEPSSALDIPVVEALDESDREILEIFLEEAQDLQEQLDKTLHNWEQQPDDLSQAAEAQRVLHTLKGGARLAGLTEIGDQAHDFEANILKAQQGQIAINDDLFKQYYKIHDLLTQKVEAVEQSLSSDGFVSLGEKSILVEADELNDTASVSTDIESSAAESSDPSTEVIEPIIGGTNEDLSDTQGGNNVVPLRPGSTADTPFEMAGAADNAANTADDAVDAPVAEAEQPLPVTSKALSPTAQPSPGAAQAQATARKAPQELVKVSADLLDNLVNLAGETSIGRGRLEQQVTDFSYTLDEMDVTLDRLRDQLRRLDSETQEQVQFRQERQGPDYDDFDPLEMDRYSAMQQLSRALVESASDLLDLKETLSDKTRDAETLLLQQSRVNTELQEGLMKSRMVPFQRLVPRLRRIVRQISLELGKQVDLKVFNADGEMDRTILERLISPLEHMVRNAVDHGMESEADRLSAGKAAVGSIELDLSRDGGDIVLKLRDDGKGVNLQAVRKKAIERGLMESDADLSDQEITQFILQAGFSTAEKVTQISGRGVGMDVVTSEIKQMGGSVAIQSEAGQGTEFTVRLPFTVSVNRALMVRVGDDLYAIPLNNIEGIVRASASELQTLYDIPSDERRYSYAGNDYRLEYLGNMLDNEAQPKFAAQHLPLPVLLIRGAAPFALQVDSLLGSREIVVKTLGPQFASVMGVSGGTILGDGSVVIILDLPAMIRTQASIEYQHAKALDVQDAERRHELESRLPRILVVDDSVTVRKVTTRLLERNGMEVFTAKDGVDAMATLQDHKPDLMLLDIEMPRMDGFEVASQVRHDSRLKDIPIIMITSRTGDKHRERALSIGVNEYMGKPFQEDLLLSTMNQLLGRKEH
ncbi:Hpt domain-containing protein [Bacterioplanoides sp. SCSIO 12839]|uniref:Hpt domain-containing protein n=1 Tax=Bacterioplanoides sp. SCSIO 12839 TaxID=2829569 RepID=UPI0021071E60|nr:Hpt domain-containing protein [Bacterioplanoides sp. SCSIO 12839]UTW48031.1 Hpt domain-containing protein [Bacterioplanoides sp. SCSIO 12839]